MSNPKLDEPLLTPFASLFVQIPADHKKNTVVSTACAKKVQVAKKNPVCPDDPPSICRLGIQALWRGGECEPRSATYRDVTSDAGPR